MQSIHTNDMHCFSINMSSGEEDEGKTEEGANKREVPDSPFFLVVKGPAADATDALQP
jgi:hypothetical protein